MHYSADARLAEHAKLARSAVDASHFTPEGAFRDASSRVYKLHGIMQAGKLGTGCPASLKTEHTFHLLNACKKINELLPSAKRVYFAESHHKKNY